MIIPLLPPDTLRTVIYDGFISSTDPSGYHLAHISEAIRDRSVSELGFALDLSFKVTPFAGQTR